MQTNIQTTRKNQKKQKIILKSWKIRKKKDLANRDKHQEKKLGQNENHLKEDVNKKVDISLYFIDTFVPKVSIEFIDGKINFDIF